jgi:hypothetical protein
VSVFPPSALTARLPLRIGQTVAQDQLYYVVFPSTWVKSWFTSLNRSKPLSYTYFPVFLLLPFAKFQALWPVWFHFSEDMLVIIFPWVSSLKLLLVIVSYPVFCDILNAYLQLLSSSFITSSFVVRSHLSFVSRNLFRSLWFCFVIYSNTGFLIL